MGVHVAAYAAAGPLNPDHEAALYGAIADLGAAGLEQPFFDRLHRRDEGWLLGQLRPHWSFVLTLLPGVMDRLAKDRHFGLASTNPDGRARALDFTESARRAVERLNARMSRRAVLAVEIHSAPRRVEPHQSSVSAFADSLSLLRRQNWMGASLIVEHCDAAVGGHPPDKGFLGLDDEIAAISLSSGETPVKLGINWGRSALETRSARGPLSHIRKAAKNNLLASLFFSGVTPDDAHYGSWKDSHAPFSTQAASSLLTPAHAKAALAAAPECPIIGLKLQPLPAALSLARRVAMIQDGLTHCRRPEETPLNAGS
ncbi:MAG: DUF4862 family protein [Elusimicrobiota bacterium]